MKPSALGIDLPVRLLYIPFLNDKTAIHNSFHNWETSMIKKVAVIGLGQMGGGITQVTAQAGFSVLATDASEDLIARGVRNITKQLDRAIEKGKLDVAGK